MAGDMPQKYGACDPKRGMIHDVGIIPFGEIPALWGEKEKRKRLFTSLGLM